MFTGVGDISFRVLGCDLATYILIEGSLVVHLIMEGTKCGLVVIFYSGSR